MNPRRAKAYIYFLIVASIWGVAGPIIKYVLGLVNPAIFLLYRFTISAAFALLIFAITKPKLPKKAGVWILIIIYSLLTSTISLSLLFFGLKNTTVLDMSVINMISPLFTSMAAFYILHDRITNKEKQGMLIAFMGSLLIVIQPILENGYIGVQFFGNLLIFSTLFVNTAGSILLKKLLRQKIDPSFLANFSFLLGFVSFIPLVAVNYNFSQIVSTINSLPITAHLGVFYMAVISGTLAYTLSNTAQKTIEVSEASLFTYLQPIFGATLAVVWLKEMPTQIFIVGSAVTILGVIIAEIKKSGLK